MRRTAHLLLLAIILAMLTSVAIASAVVGDVTFVRKVKGSDDVAPAVFPHWVHRVKYRCYVCHNISLGFKMKAGATSISMDDIDEGKYCGACHKGKPAFAVSFETCNRCHRQ